MSERTKERTSQQINEGVKELTNEPVFEIKECSPQEPQGPNKGNVQNFELHLSQQRPH